MRAILFVHILAASLGLISGYVALYAAKGAPLHRKAGVLFVYTMLAMSFCGVIVSIGRGIAMSINIPAGLLTAYLVVTSLATVRPPKTGARWLALAALLVASGVAVADAALAFDAIANGGKRMYLFPYVMFGTVALLGAIGDLRMLRSGALEGSRRLARHLWRMTFALFIAAMSFFIGQAKVIPKPLRIPGLLALPVLAVLVTMFYWMWRVRTKAHLAGKAEPLTLGAAG
jgi:hypothetical protein